MTLMNDTGPLTYQLPPKAIADVVDAPETPDVSLSPDRTSLLLLERPGYPPIAELAQPELRLAGLRLNPRTNGPSRAGHYTGLTFLSIDHPDAPHRPVTGIPAGARIGSVRWSPDSASVAFTVTEEDAIRLWALDVATAHARPLAPQLALNAAAGAPYEWSPDNASLICLTIPPSRGPAPEAPTVPIGPVVEENTGQVAPARTYQDLLASPNDEALFEHYLLAQVVRLTPRGHVTPLGQPNLITRAEVAPGGAYLLVETVHRPYSYVVPMFRFPFRVEVWDAFGHLVRQLADLPLAEEVPISFDAVRTGPRSFDWRADSLATLEWVEALDLGDPRVETPVRDRVFALEAPFTEQPRILADLALRYAGTSWGDGDLALVSERWWKTRRTRTWIVSPDVAAESAPATFARRNPAPLFDRSWEDRYHDPGTPARRPTPAGTRILHTGPDKSSLFLIGPGASP